MKALIVGCADCVWDDLERVPLRWPDIVIAINDIGMYLNAPIQHWVTLHSDRLSAWRSVRRVHGYEPGEDTYECWTRDPETPVSAIVRGCKQLPHELGTSAYLAVNVARHVGATDIVLAGVPMDNVPHFWGHRPWEYYAKHRNEWWSLAQLGKLHGVRSLSGWTANLLGMPDLT